MFDDHDFVPTDDEEYDDPGLENEMESDGESIEEVDEDEYQRDFDADDHQCDINCDCDAVENGRWDDYDVMTFMSWGECDITPSGAEVLRFLSSIMRGKSMSQNKAQDILRYVMCVCCMHVLCVCAVCMCSICCMYVLCVWRWFWH